MTYSISSHRRIASLLILSIGIFALFFILAMLFYAGGTQLEPQRDSYSFLTNFFSDTGRTVSFSGKPNTLSMVCFGAALVPVNVMLLLFHGMNFFFYRGKHVPWNWVSSISGAVSALAAILIPFFPDDLVPGAHLFATLSFSNLLLLSLVGYAVLIMKDPDMKKGSAFLILCYVGYLVIYLTIVMADLGFKEDLRTLLQATGQKIAIIGGFSCFFVLALGIRRRLLLSQ